jgi:hypothetical protein
VRKKRKKRTRVVIKNIFDLSMVLKNKINAHNKIGKRILANSMIGKTKDSEKKAGIAVAKFCSRKIYFQLCTIE